MAGKHKTEVNEDQLLEFLRDAVGKIKTEEDPLALNQYRQIFKKAVPFHLRSYFAAYLLKQIDSGNNMRVQGPLRRSERGGRGGRDQSERLDRPDRREEKQARADTRAKEPRSEESKRIRGENRPEPRPSLPDDVSTTLFVSIGRNRRVYPRDLIGLILQNAEIDRDHIGDIRVLDNYSFVQVLSEDAEKVIATLNEFEYRGRKLAVSYSRKREDGPASGEQSSPVSDEVTDEVASEEIEDSLSEETDSAENEFDSEYDESDELEGEKKDGDVQ